MGLAWALGIRSLICETNSIAMIELIKGPINVYHLYAGLIVRISELLARDWEISLNHVYRESNMCVDWPTKFRASCNEQLVLWESPHGCWLYC